MPTTNQNETSKNVSSDSDAKSGNSSSSTKLSKKSVRNPFLEILRKSRTTFKKQIIRDAQMKKSAIEHTLKLSDKDSDDERNVFLGNFYDMVEYRLLDSNRFIKDCEALGVNPFNVAQHVVFDGNKRLDEVLVLGLRKAYGNEVLKMREPIYSKEELEKGRICPVQETGLNSANLDEQAA
jgi:hypothetical protein